MSECILMGKAFDPNVPKYDTELTTEIITVNTKWVVPKAKNQEFSIRIFGGGGGNGSGGAGCCCGGGGGWMNNSVIILNNGDGIQINIGDGGICGGSAYENMNGNQGGTSFFGDYLSANGGGGGIGIWTGTTPCGKGGDGSSGGGGSGYTANTFLWYYNGLSGGRGYQFGGGGGGGGATNEYVSNYGTGGIGGQYGGNGGNGGGVTYRDANTLNADTETSNIKSNDGINTIGIGLDFEGHGSGGYSGIAKRSPSNTYIIYSGKGGIGGYGGNGGNGGSSANAVVNNAVKLMYTCGGGGGGGGYGADGGNGEIRAGGGGGGYGGKGADAAYLCGGGGGGYGPSNYGAGGGGKAVNGRNGMSGVCIIQYYKQIN